MNQLHIQKIAELLELSGSVPLPGGHGTHFLQIRKACKDYKEAPGVVGRCYVCLAMLGDSQARRQDSAMERELTKYTMGSPNGFEEGTKIERWNRVPWVQYALAW